MRVIFIEDEETCIKIDLIEPRGHPLLASAERIPPPPLSPPSCLDPLFQDTNTRSLIFTRGIFKLFLSFKLEILILPILIIQFSIFILLPVKQGRIGPPLGWKEDLYADEKVSLRNFYEQSEGNILLNWIN